ncbi:type II toxin-antitoxin system RelE/ParE family toxin [Pseudorhodoplanes sp.]|uniref:type II toxin-antitoxin system RelE/ParE family toxin n=1 Tax=Pseudorhodoplanes sp. TaxID=1934341 RepID=UPI00391D9D47
MAYRLRITPFAQKQIDDFVTYLRDYSEPFAREQIVRLKRILAVDIAAAPNTWSHFAFTGAPYRAYLFRVGRRTQYWVVYTVDDDARTVDVLHFWNAMRDPERFEMT